MKSAGWSSLVLGTVLATSAAGFARAEEAPPPARPSLAGVATERADDEADRILLTGSIAPLAAPTVSPLKPLSPTNGGLVELPRHGEAVREAKPTVSGEAKPTAHEQAKSTTGDPSKPTAKAEAEPTAVAAPAPTVAETAKPVETGPVEPAPASADVATDESSKPVAAPIAIEPVVAATSTTTEPSSAPSQATLVTEPATTALPPTASIPAEAAPAAPAPEPTRAAAAPEAPTAAPTPRSATLASSETPPSSLLPVATSDASAEEFRIALKAQIEAQPALPGIADDKADRAAITAFYAERGYRPLFTDTAGAAPRAQVLAAQLATAAEDGLEPADYALPAIGSALPPDVRSKAELTIARTAIRYARHLRSGRFDPLRLSDLVTAKPPKTDAGDVLRTLATTNPDATGEALAAYAPPHEGYRRLKAVLADLRGTRPETPVVRLLEGPVLKPGQKDDRVATLRARLGVSTIASDSDLFDPALTEAVKSFQRDRGLKVTGSVGRDTVAALNGQPNGASAKIADVIVNMERWRWLPRDLGELNVFVNIPDYHLDVMKDGRSIHHARVITGRPANQTPIFSETMQYIVVNPYWNVPVSIIKKEMLSRAQETNGGSLARGNYEVEVGNHTVDPATVDWTQVQPGNVSIRQRPGDGNALGNIKFMFPNQHSVYIHDTSSRGLFSQTFRALSHGCVRVQEPFSFADAVLSEEPGGFNGVRLKGMLGGGEKYVNLKRFVPVHMTYFTQFVDADGTLQTRRDVYGHDARMKQILGL